MAELIPATAAQAADGEAAVAAREAAREAQWVAATTIVISGATGYGAYMLNGAFDVVADRPVGEPPVYRKQDGSDLWLHVEEDS